MDEINERSVVAATGPQPSRYLSVYSGPDATKVLSGARPNNVSVKSEVRRKEKKERKKKKTRGYFLSSVHVLHKT